MRHAVREALAAFRRAPLLTVLSAAMVALALFVVGLFAVAAYNLRLGLEAMEERVEVVAYLRDAARLDEVARAQEEILAMPEVLGIRYVSKDQALDIARTELADFGEVFADLDVNPLPASFEIQLLAGRRDPISVQRVADQASSYAFVEDVRFGEEWVDKLFLLRRIGGITAGILGTGFALVAALIIATAIRIAIFARREEIYIMRLVGAKDGFIRRPFLLEGTITGLIGGGVAALLSFGSYVAVDRFVFRLSWVPAAWVAAGIAAGCLFGLVSSGLALRRYLREV